MKIQKSEYSILHLDLLWQNMVLKRILHPEKAMPTPNREEILRVSAISPIYHIQIRSPLLLLFPFSLPLLLTFAQRHQPRGERDKKHYQRPIHEDHEIKRPFPGEDVYHY